MRDRSWEGILQRAVVQLLWLWLLAWFSCSEGASKRALHFAPTSQALFLGVTLSISGEYLTTSDRILIAHPPATGGLAEGGGCGLLNEIPVALSGGDARFFHEVNDSGQAAQATFTLRQEHPGAVVCVQLWPSRTWTRVGTSSFSVMAPVVSSVTSSTGDGNALSISRAERLALTLAGSGLVQGAERLAFKLSSLDCAVHGSTAVSDLAGGEGVGCAKPEPSTRTPLRRELPNRLQRK